MATGYDYDATIIVYKNDGTSTNYEINKSGRAGQQGYGFTVYVSFYSSESYTRTGYNFIGYRQDNSSSYPMKYPGDSVPFAFGAGGGSQTQRFYCQWQLKTYTVSYNANGGSGAPSSQTKTHGVNLTLSSTVPTRTNYIFQGWATSSTGAVQYQPGGTFTTNANTTLYAIWKQAAATLNTVSNTEIGASGTATWTIINTAHTYVLNVTFPGATTVEVTSAANTSSCSFTIPSSWLSTFSNAASGTATATLYTYNGDTLVGSTAKTFTVSVPASIVPTISAFTATPHSDNATVEGWGVGVQGYSYFTLSVTATPGTSASISNISFTGHQIATTSASTTADTAVVTSTGSLIYTVTVTDSRGRTATQTATVTVYEYSNPTISELQAVRCLQDGTASDTEGNYLKAYPIYVFSSVNGNNALTVKEIDYKANDSSTWLVGDASAPSGAWSSVFGTADVAKAFDVRLTITDSLGNTYALEVTVPSVVGYAFGLKNDRVRFGGPVRQAGFECDFPAQFDSTVDVVQRRCSASLSSAGWYRVFTVTGTDDEILGIDGFAIDINIMRSSVNTAGETHKIRLSTPYNQFVFSDESSNSRAFGITKIRYTSSSAGGHIDIYYSLSNSDTVYVDFCVHVLASKQSNFTAESVQSVADAPAGETVMTEYVFALNTSIVDVVTSGNVRHSYRRSGDVVVIGMQSLGGTSLTQNVTTTVATLPVDLRPLEVVNFAADNTGGSLNIGGSIQSNGDVELYATNGSTSYWRFNVSYIV